ncbi:MAG TPA: amidase domain-containing protein [Actinokineospora sp.]|nr:amidase domain-containing protein [Actinokineospora sp.]
MDDDGTCEPWDQPDSQGDNGHTEAMEWKPKVESMIRDAVEAATQADTLAADQLRRLRDGVNVTDATVALEDLQGRASQAQIEMIHFSLPHGQSPESVAAWWNSLSDAQRRELELAVPVELADLNGIPDDVKDRLRGPGPLNRVEMVRFALDRWDDTSLDHPAQNDCTRFASIALAHAGMPENSDWTSSTIFKAGDPTHSWAGSGELHDYLTTETNSHEVPVSEARPGDLIFLRHGAEGGDPEAGDIHHTAVVTSVTPDGVVHYTQHDDSKVNISMQGRERSVEQGLGDQDYVIVRVDPTEK